MDRTENSTQPTDNVTAVTDDRWLIDIFELARLTTLSLSTLRRLDGCREIPGRVTVRRRVLFVAETVRQWVLAGLPNRDEWLALQKRNNKR
jgi:predicted DNA-binding transcriptional regulator AlpA